MDDIFSKKNFLFLVIAWGIFFFLIMWFLGGACTDFFSGGTCFSKDAVSFLGNIPVLQLFLPFNTWVSAMYWFAPVAGFIFTYLALNWYNTYFDSKFSFSIWIVPILVFVLLFGYYINLSFYYGESAAIATNRSNGQAKYGLYFCFGEISSNDCGATVYKLNQEYIAQAGRTDAKVIPQLIPVRFWDELKESIFLTFILGALAAWIPLFLKNYFESRKD